MEGIENIIKALTRQQSDSATIIVCMFTGAPPSLCAAMPRLPNPEIGMPFDDTFPTMFAQAIEANPSIHDGAIMVGRADASLDYKVAGWSFRLFAGGTPTASVAVNRGSAFNSCLSMSTVAGVDCIYLATRSGLERI